MSKAPAAVFRDGVDPVTGAPLGRPLDHYEHASPPEDPRVPARRRAVVGYDLTFTAPKSVSVLWGLADDANRATVFEAHRGALKQALDSRPARGDSHPGRRGSPPPNHHAR